MSCTTSPLRMHRPLLLAARLAAGAFSRPRRKRISLRRQSSWTPVLLRWLRKAVGTRVGASPRASGWAGLWTSHFHLHLEFARHSGVAVARAPGQGYVVAPSRWISIHALSSRLASERVDRRAGHRSGMRWRPMRAMEGGMTGVRTPPPNISSARFAASVEAMAPVPMREVIAVARSALSSSERSAIMAKEQPGLHLDARAHDRLSAPIHPKGPHCAPIVHFISRRSSLQTRTEPLGRRRLVADGSASRADALPSVSLATRSTMRPTVASTIASEQSIHARIDARSNIGFPWLADASASRPALQRKRERLSVGLVQASHELARASWSGELAWRSNRGTSVVAGDRLRSPAPSAQPVSVAGSMSGLAHPGPSASRASDKAVVCATVLDPVLADRFADEVIRRMERRMRIERERRGL
jgi:hypothetical protein